MEEEKLENKIEATEEEAEEQNKTQEEPEKLKNVSIQFKNEHNEIPWGKIIGFRNGIVHEYGKTDYSTVYEILTKSIYQLRDLLEENIQTYLILFALFINYRKE